MGDVRGFAMGLVRCLCILFWLLHLLDGVPRNTINAVADQIFTTSGGRFGRGSHEPKYRVQLHSQHSPYHPEEAQEEILMSNKDGQNYICFLPMAEETKDLKMVARENSSRSVMEREQKIKLKTPDELIEILKDKCFYRHEDWWSYEFCFQKHVRQLHVQNDMVVEEYVLGVFDANATVDFNNNHYGVSTIKDPRYKDASKRYHAQQYTNGTLCDLTNQPRETEVRFVCSRPSVVISSIKETYTCKYVVMVQCPLLCRHPMFQEKAPLWQTIHCNEVGARRKGPSLEDVVIKDRQISLIADEST